MNSNDWKISGTLVNGSWDFLLLWVRFCEVSFLHHYVLFSELYTFYNDAIITSTIKKGITIF